MSLSTSDMISLAKTVRNGVTFAQKHFCKKFTFFQHKFTLIRNFVILEKCV